MEDAIELDERLLRLLEIHLASTPEGAAAAEFWRAEQYLLDDLPLENAPAIFLLQAMPMTAALTDLRDLQATLPQWMAAHPDHSLAGALGPFRSSYGLAIQSGDVWRFDLRPSGYIGLDVRSALTRQPPPERFFFLGKDLLPRLAAFGDLLKLVAEHLALVKPRDWRLRCTVLNGPALLLRKRGDSKLKGRLPDDLIDFSGAPTASIPAHLETLRSLLEDTCSEDALLY